MPRPSQRAGAGSSAPPATGRETPAWRSPPVLAVTVFSAAAGFGQFGAAAALADVAAAFGEVTEGASVSEQAGLSGTVLGVGLAVIRLASLGAFPLAGQADRAGRRRTLTGYTVTGLVIVMSVSLAPSYWWFVALFALSRPLFSATNALGQVMVAEHTTTADRTRAIALISAGYGVGSGLVSVIRAVGGEALGFRGLFALAVLPLVAVVVAQRRVRETERFRAVASDPATQRPRLGSVPRPLRGRVAVLVAVSFAVAVITGPANSFLFVYAENVRGLSADATAAMVLAAGITGLAGLLVGRWAADRLGRRPTIAVALVALAAAGMVAYSGSVPALVGGYLAAVLAGAAFAPALGALGAELVPTAVRATMSGWLVVAGVLGAAVGLVAFGAIADAGDRWGLAAVVAFSPAAVAAGVIALVPETRGGELDTGQPF